MYLKGLELSGFKSFARKSELEFSAPATAIVGPNGSGKSNIAEAFRFVLGEQSMKSMRTKRGEDLIWNGSRSVSRMNRASVSVTFNNEGNIFPVEYSEVTLTREVYRDGGNRYRINGAQVRLKDVLELLASARIGSSQHHIISQGEADRVLSVNALERRAMIEDALGLRIYEFKKTESERKLKKTEENLKEVRTLQKEIEPHLKFLETQVKRIEQARELRQELVREAKEYFHREEQYLQKNETRLRAEVKDVDDALASLDTEIAKQKETIQKNEENVGRGKVLELEEKERMVRRQKDDLSRRLGRLEGMIETERRTIKKREEERIQEVDDGESGSISRKSVLDHLVGFENDLVDLLSERNFEKQKDRIQSAMARFRDFLKQEQDRKILPEIDTENVERMEDDRDRLLREVRDLSRQEEDGRKEAQAIKDEMERERGEFRDIERDIFAKMTARTELSNKKNKLENELSLWQREQNDFERDLSEFSMLVDKSVLAYREFALPEEQDATDEDRDIQREARRQLERKKIKVEEMGGSGAEVISEYETLKEREEFFKREVGDLEKSKSSLEALIHDLERQLDVEFKDGLKQINAQFQDFFSVIFGGGQVSLRLEKKQKRKRRADGLEEAMHNDTENASLLNDADGDEKEEKEGLEIALSLPHKRLRGIDMLSGGERSLTSVALLFAISQVNPPPFLVLDETDAALDESNSRRYGEMLEELSKRTQLIIITHNRETMSRAGILYGVTVGQDAVSKILSVKFETAEQQAAR